MLIEVTQDDITYGFPCDSANCPIARAFRRNGIEVLVGMYCVVIDGRLVQMPENVRMWRAMYDWKAMNSVEEVSKPFSFEWNEETNEFV